MNFRITPLRSTDFLPRENPTGEKLLSRAEKPFQVWIPKDHLIVLGNSQDPEIELNVDSVVKDQIPVYKRMSGGGTVLLSNGCICIGLRFRKSKELGIHDYFLHGSGLIQKVVRSELDIELTQRGISDLVYEDKKISGCAMYMPKDFVLYLVSILVDPDFDEIQKYLAHPSKEPDYRGQRTHRNFLTSLAIASGKTIESSKLVKAFEKSIEEKMTDSLDWI